MNDLVARNAPTPQWALWEHQAQDTVILKDNWNDRSATFDIHDMADTIMKCGHWPTENPFTDMVVWIRHGLRPFKIRGNIPELGIPQLEDKRNA